jgi:transposase
MRSRTPGPSLELSDAAWAAIAPLMPPRPHGPGRPARDHRTIVNGILWVLESEAPWRRAPSRYGPWQTLYARYALWQTDGTWHRVQAALRSARRRARKARVVAVVLATAFAAIAPQPLRAERLGGVRRAVRHQMAQTPDRVGRRRSRTTYVAPDSASRRTG